MPRWGKQRQHRRRRHGRRGRHHQLQASIAAAPRIKHDATAAHADVIFLSQTLAATSTAVLFWKVSKVRTDSGPNGRKTPRDETSAFGAVLPSMAAAELGSGDVASFPLPFLKSYARPMCVAWNPRLTEVRPVVERAVGALCQALVGET